MRAGRPRDGPAGIPQLMQQVIPDLTNYYKYRHNQSTSLQELINKYRR